MARECRKSLRKHLERSLNDVVPHAWSVGKDFGRGNVKGGDPEIGMNLTSVRDSKNARVTVEQRLRR